jgi:hypothetical protein
MFFLLYPLRGSVERPNYTAYSSVSWSLWLGAKHLQLVTTWAQQDIFGALCQVTGNVFFVCVFY